MSTRPRTSNLDDGIDAVLYSREQIAARVAELGAELSTAYRDRVPLVVGVLNGCFPFLADLVRAMPIPLEVEFIAVSSYQGGAQSSGVVRLLKDLDTPIAGRHVLLVEDIVDTGLTVRYLIDNLETRRPASVEVCALLDKAQARTVPVRVRYVGLPCPNVFVVGYGLDYGRLYRNLPYIGVLGANAQESS